MKQILLLIFLSCGCAGSFSSIRNGDVTDIEFSVFSSPVKQGAVAGEIYREIDKIFKRKFKEKIQLFKTASLMMAKSSRKAELFYFTSLIRLRRKYVRLLMYTLVKLEKKYRDYQAAFTVRIYMLYLLREKWGYWVRSKAVQERRRIFNKVGTLAAKLRGRKMNGVQKVLFALFEAEKLRKSGKWRNYCRLLETVIPDSAVMEKDDNKSVERILQLLKPGWLLKEVKGRIVLDLAQAYMRQAGGFPKAHELLSGIIGQYYDDPLYSKIDNALDQCRKYLKK